eukprot:COSAG04_NODE_3343_length_2910_cov_634.524724_3_plen_185_part_00
MGRGRAPSCARGPARHLRLSRRRGRPAALGYCRERRRKSWVIRYTSGSWRLGERRNAVGRALELRTAAPRPEAMGEPAKRRKAAPGRGLSGRITAIRAYSCQRHRSWVGTLTCLCAMSRQTNPSLTSACTRVGNPHGRGPASHTRKTLHGRSESTGATTTSPTRAHGVASSGRSCSPDLSRSVD